MPGVGAGLGALLLAAAPQPAAAPLRLADVARPGRLAPAGPLALAAAPDPRAPLRAWVVAELTERVPALGETGAERLARTILEEAAATGLDPVLVLAIIEVESGWDPGAVSNRGALGLMQLRPSTLASEARSGGFATDDPHEPVMNVRAGIRYFARMVRHFGDADLALVAYNSGPTRLASYVQAVGEVPDHLLAYARRVRREEKVLRRAIGPAAQPVLASATGDGRP